MRCVGQSKSGGGWAAPGSGETRPDRRRQAIGGSLEVAIPAPPDDNFLIVFSGQIRAFGVWVVNNNMKAVIPTFTALDAGGGTIETVQFAGAAIDGTIGGIADYGFLGIVSATPIASVRMVKDATIFDDLRFSDVPETATLSLPALGGLALLRRRRR